MHRLSDFAMPVCIFKAQNASRYNRLHLSYTFVVFAAWKTGSLMFFSSHKVAAGCHASNLVVHSAMSEQPGNSSAAI